MIFGGKSINQKEVYLFNGYSLKLNKTIQFLMNIRNMISITTSREIFTTKDTLDSHSVMH